MYILSLAVLHKTLLARLGNNPTGISLNECVNSGSKGKGGN